MYRKYYLVEVVLLLLLSHGGWNGPSVTLLSCTSESSKLVRDVVQKRFLSVVDRYQVPLPLECPLHLKRDMFWWLQTELEATKREGEEAALWHCPVCGQKFGCENNFVSHWDASHSRSLLGMAGETVCLDDYCDVFRCDMLRKKKMKMEDEEKVKEFGTQGITIFQHRHKEAEYEDDDELKEKKKSCDPKAMSQIHHKCRSLIRQCTLGMLTNLSSKDFQEIEEDLDQSICSFLTCDKYWDDFEPQVHRVPMLVFAIFGLIFVSLFCFCYYGLWVLLEKSTFNSSQVCCSCQKASSSIDNYYRQKRQKHRHRQNSPDSIAKPNPLHYVTAKSTPENTPRKNHPEYANRKSSPETNAKQKSTEYILRENSPEYNIRQNSFDYSTKRNAIERDSKQNSPEYSSKQSSLEYNSRQSLSECKYRQNSREFNSRHVSPEYNSRQSSPEYSTRQNSPDYDSRRTSPEYNVRHNSSDYESRQNSPEYNSNHNSEHFSKRNPSRISSRSGENSPEYCFRQNANEYHLKHNASEYSPEQPNSSDSKHRMNSSDPKHRINFSEFKHKPNSTQEHYYQNEYKHKSLDIHQRKKPGIAYSQSSNTLQLPQTIPNRTS